MPINSPCAEKTTYLTEEIAEKHAKQSLWANGYYRCVICGKFHLTSWVHRPRWLHSKLVPVKHSSTPQVGSIGIALLKALKDKKNREKKASCTPLERT